MPSTVIDKFYYDSNANTLLVVFRSGITYRYKNVPEAVYNEMKKAFSKGIFLNTHIKGIFDFEKVDT